MAEQVYLRIKRRNQTFCLLANKSATILDVKQQIAAALQQHGGGTRESLRLLHNSQVLDDADTVQDMQDDDVMHVVFAVSDTEWEAVDLVVANANYEMQE